MEPTAFIDTLVGHVPGLEVVRLDPAGRVVHARGRRLDAARPGDPASQLFDRAWQQPILEAVDQAAAGAPAHASVVEPDGTTLAVTATPEPHGRGAVVLTLRDVTAERETARRARTAQQRFATVFEGSRAALAVVDADLTRLQANPAAVAITGAPAERHGTPHVTDRVDADDAELVVASIGSVVRGERSSSTVDHVLRHADGRRLRVRTHTVPLPLHDGRRGALVETVDLSEQHSLADELRRYTTRDPLTGLLNRDGLEASVRDLTARDGGPPAETTLVLASVDDYAAIEAGLGHTDAGLVLREVAASLCAAVRSGDPVARVTGDEFAILLPGVEADAAGGVVDGLLARFQTGIATRDGDAARLRVTLSAGVSALTPGVGLERALAGAGIAVYAAQQAGRGRWMAGL